LSLGPGLALPRNDGGDAHSVRYRFDCRRSCSQGQRPVWVGDRPFADSGAERPVDGR